MSPMSVAEPIAEPSAPGPKAQPATVEPFVLPVGTLQTLVEGAGMQWVHSDAERVRHVQEAMALEPKPLHVPRERKPVVLPDEGPLVLVETRKDLAQLRMPFDPPGA
jgi:ribonuclease E